MVDLQDVSGGAGAAALQCDHAIFTSLPSRIGEGYRLVAWNVGVRPEERVELTRRAPSHGSLCPDSQTAVVQMRLQSSGRVAWGFTRFAGTEHTRRGGGRVWTDFLLCDEAGAQREGLHPVEFRAALAAEPAPKAQLGTAPLAAIAVARRGSGEPAGGSRVAARVAAVAALLVSNRACVIAAGPAPVEMLEDSLRMIPASLRGAISVGAGLRFSSARGVRASVTDRIDQETLRATRGQGVECIDVQTAPAAFAPGAIAGWLALMVRWWSEERAAEAVELADKLAGGWTAEEIAHVASLCEAIDRREARPDELDRLLMRRSAA